MARATGSLFLSRRQARIELWEISVLARRVLFERRSGGAARRGLRDPEFRRGLIVEGKVDVTDDAVSRETRLNQEVGREAIHSELRTDDLNRIVEFRPIETAATSKESHLSSPSRGAQLSATSAQQLAAEDCDVQVLVSDGLSAEAVHHNIPDLLPVLLDGLAGRNISVGQPLLAQYGRVKLAEQIAERLDTRVVVHLIGERPGGDAQASRSLSAYILLRLTDPEAQQAAAAGCLITVNCDAHSPSGIDLMEYGIAIARKAWLKPDQILNCWTQPQVLGWLGARAAPG